MHRTKHACNAQHILSNTVVPVSHLHKLHIIVLNCHTPVLHVQRLAASAPRGEKLYHHEAVGVVSQNLIVFRFRFDELFAYMCARIPGTAGRGRVGNQEIKHTLSPAAAAAEVSHEQSRQGSIGG